MDTCQGETHDCSLFRNPSPVSRPSSKHAALIVVFRHRHGSLALPTTANSTCTHTNTSIPHIPTYKPNSAIFSNVYGRDLKFEQLNIWRGIFGPVPPLTLSTGTGGRQRYVWHPLSTAAVTMVPCSPNYKQQTARVAAS